MLSPALSGQVPSLRESSGGANALISRKGTLTAAVMEAALSVLAPVSILVLLTAGTPTAARPLSQPCDSPTSFATRK